ncbi:MAG: LysR family transcriptional regulator [Amphritea sp.]|nr:LysR family transcriptional regulator [Amphritea sp.]
MSSNLSIRHLRAFREVAQCGSFTQAAQRLHLTQSTLTATVKQLEQEIGLTLFDRTTRRVVLTREGQQFRSVAERLISDFDTAITDLRPLPASNRARWL